MRDAPIARKRGQPSLAAVGEHALSVRASAMALLMSQPVCALPELLRSMQPRLEPGVYAFVSLAHGADLRGVEPLAMLREAEGITLVLDETQASQAGLDVLFRAAWITLTVHSDLLAVGLTAAVATALTEAGISCNVVAAAFHDHLFVPVDAAHAALAVLQQLQERAAAAPDPSAPTRHGLPDEPGRDAFPAAVPEIPVADMARALHYYETVLGFSVDWGRDDGGIAGISQGRSRIFLVDARIRDHFGNQPPVVVWLNLDSQAQVDALHETWSSHGANILRPPQSNEWSRLHEFIVTDPDGNFLRAFYNFPGSDP